MGGVSGSRRTGSFIRNKYTQSSCPPEPSPLEGSPVASHSQHESSFLGNNGEASSHRYVGHLRGEADGVTDGGRPRLRWPRRCSACLCRGWGLCVSRCLSSALVEGRNLPTVSPTVPGPRDPASAAFCGWQTQVGDTSLRSVTEGTAVGVKAEGAGGGGVKTPPQPLSQEGAPGAVSSDACAPGGGRKTRSPGLGRLASERGLGRPSARHPHHRLLGSCALSGPRWSSEPRPGARLSGAGRTSRGA